MNKWERSEKEGIKYVGEIDKHLLTIDLELKILILQVVSLVKIVMGAYPVVHVLG